ncbi:MAG: hypothetical protein ABEJ47_05025 [Halorhabdus sp.]
MNLKQYVPAEQPLAVAFRIVPHVLFLSGCFFAVLTLTSRPVMGGLQTERLGAGAFSLGFAVVAGNKLTAEQYLGTGLSLVAAVAVGASTVGSIAEIDNALVIQILMAAYLVWMLIKIVTRSGSIRQGEDPVMGDGDQTWLE